MRDIDQIIGGLPPAQRAKVEDRAQELVGDMSMVLGRDINVIPFKPHHINARRGATPADIAMVVNNVDLIFNLAISALAGQLENLRENLPVGEVKFDDIYAGLIDLRSDILGRLEKAEDAAE